MREFTWLQRLKNHHNGRANELQETRIVGTDLIAVSLKTTKHTCRNNVIFNVISTHTHYLVEQSLPHNLCVCFIYVM